MSLLIAAAGAGTMAQVPGALRLVVCPETPCVVGIPTRMVWESIGLPTLAGYDVEAAGPGASDAEGWLWTPSAADVGTHRLTVRVRLAGALVGRVSTRLVVRAAVAAGSPSIHYVPFGDSITATVAADAYTNVLARLLTAGGITWTSLGTQQQGSADANVYHEGYSGRTARWLRGLDVDGGTQTPLYDTAGATVESIIPEYFDGLSAMPTHLHFQLPGPNDANAYGGAPEGMSAYHDTIIEALEDVIADSKAAAPSMTFSVGTIFDISEDPADFGTPGTTERNALRTKRHSLLEKVVATFSHRTAEGIYLAATHHAVTPYSANTVHPPVNPGHTDIANAIYCALRAVTG